MDRKRLRHISSEITTFQIFQTLTIDYLHSNKLRKRLTSGDILIFSMRFFIIKFLLISTNIIYYIITLH